MSTDPKNPALRSISVNLWPGPDGKPVFPAPPIDLAMHHAIRALSAIPAEPLELAAGTWDAKISAGEIEDLSTRHLRELYGAVASLSRMIVRHEQERAHANAHAQAAKATGATENGTAKSPRIIAATPADTKLLAEAERRARERRKS